MLQVILNHKVGFHVFRLRLYCIFYKCIQLQLLFKEIQYFLIKRVVRDHRCLYRVRLNTLDQCIIYDITMLCHNDIIMML